MFFWLSKVLWFLVQPLNLLLIGICLTALFAAFRWTRATRRMALTVAAVCLVIAAIPIGGAVIQVFENRFPARPTLPAQVDGIVVLGGIVDARLSKARGLPQLGGGVERVAEAVRLMRRYPAAKVIFTGGSGNPLRQDLKEAHYAPDVFKLFGVDAARILYEDQSRNTAENARLSRELADPRDGETWVLITSAFHMPRSVGAFRRAGWQVIAYPVDFETTGTQDLAPTFDFRGGLGRLSRALHECLGLLFYWLTDRTDSLFPGPEQ